MSEELKNTDIIEDSPQTEAEAAINLMDLIDQAGTVDDDEDEIDVPTQTATDIINNMLDKKSKKLKLSDIKIVSKEEKNQRTDLINAIKKGSPTYSVPCIMSGYSAKMTSLTNRDILALFSSESPVYEYRKSLYNIIYNHIVEFSIAEWKQNRPTFEEWCRLTAFSDLETLLYGIFCTTYQEESVIQYKCPKCGKTISATVKNSSIAQTNKPGVKERISEITRDGVTLQGMRDLSKINLDSKHIDDNITLVEMPATKMVFALSPISIHDFLEYLREYQNDDSVSDETGMTYQYTKFILLPTTEGGSYTKVNDRGDIMNIIKGLNVIDTMTLTKNVQELDREYYIPYGVKEQVCSQCHNEIDFVPMNMENLLFFPLLAYLSL